MAINFPDHPTNGQAYTDTGTGQTWTYELATNSWTASSLAVTGGVVYKGSVDITAAPPTGAKAGEQWSVGTGGTANAGYGPGVTGTITKGSVVMYTGTDWLEVNHSIPDATAAVKGIDTQKWTRTGTVLSPANIGDSVGIGTTKPSEALTIAEGKALAWADASGNNSARIYTTSDDSLRFERGSTNSRSMTIDGSGRLLVGTSSARSVGGLTNQVQVEGVNAGSYSQSWVRNVGGAGGASICLGKSRSGSVGGVTPVINNDQLGGIYWCGADGVDLNTAGAGIEAFVDGTPGADDMPGRLVFSTTASGASSPTERLRITKAGLVGIGTPSPDNKLHVSVGDSSGSSHAGAQVTIESSVASGLQFLAGTTSYSQIRFGDSGDNGAGSIIYNHNDNALLFGTNNGTEKVRIDALGKLLVGGNLPAAPNISLNANGSASFKGAVTATVTPPSDARFKENITPANPQLADVVALGKQLKNFDWNDEAPLNDELRAVRQLGLIAQEAERVSPGIVKTIKRTKQGKELTPETVIPAVYKDVVDPQDEENFLQELVTPEQIIPATYEEVDDSFKGISHDALIMKLLGAVAELSAEVEALKAAK